MYLEYLLDHIRKRYPDKSFNVQCCARELNISESFLREIVNYNFNTCTQRLIETVRLEAAIKIISKNDAAIYSVCSDTGYSNQKTFRQAVKRRFEISPRELKEKISNSKNAHNECEAIINELWDSLNHTSDFYR